MEQLSRDLRTCLSLFLPLPAIKRLRMCSKTLNRQWDEPFSQRLTACAKKSIDASCGTARLLLLFQTNAEGVFCLFRTSEDRFGGPGWHHFGSNQGYITGTWEELRGWFVYSDGQVELRCREKLTNRSLTSEGKRSVCNTEASAIVGPKTVTVTGLPAVLVLNRESHGPFSFTMVAFYKKQCEILVKNDVSK